MQQSGEHRIDAPVGAVWQALNDPDVLCRCIEGCQSMERVGEDAFRAVVKAKVGPVSAPFTAEIAIADQDPPHACTLSGQVKGGAAGFGKGSAKVRLAEDGGGTLLTYQVEGSVGGKLAQVGQRLIDGAARKMADDFFAAFQEAVAPAAQSAPAPAPSARPAERRSPALWWGLAAAGLVVIVLAVLLAR
jgi:carbon monoxide dehydrogenase subunit G